MITHLYIEGFKAIDKASLIFEPITILTGKNSSGKSSVLQTLIQVQHFIELHERMEVAKESVQYLHYSGQDSLRKFSTLAQPISVIRNKNTNARKVIIELEYNDNTKNKLIQSESKDNNVNGGHIDMDVGNLSNLHYLSADRVPIFINTNTDKLYQKTVDHLGRNTSFVLTKNRNLPLDDELCAGSEAKTLDFQLDYWLSRIVNQKISAVTEYQDVQKQVTFMYSMNDIENIGPDSVGTGQNHLVHILLTCLLAKKGEIVVIENPELHLHPKAQAALSEFFTMIANAGIQLIIETHSEHIIHKFCYQVYKKNLENSNVIIHYKESVGTDFETIHINKRGHYADQEGNAIMFPSGFFDATLSEILEVS